MASDSLVGRAGRMAKQIVEGLSKIGEPEEPDSAPAPEQTTAKKAPAKKSRAPKGSAPKSTVKKTSATSSRAAAKAAPATPRKTMPAKNAASSAHQSLVVRDNEDPWTKSELAEVKEHLENDVVRLSKELEIVEEDLQDLMRDAGDGAGQDTADIGATSFERDQEMTIANNARDMLTQTKHALERITDGSYGVCEECGEPIGKLRLMAFPRATLCMTCKKREERR